MLARRLLLVALLAFVSHQAQAGTVSASLSLGPGTILSGQTSVPFYVTEFGLATFQVNFGYTITTAPCLPIDPANYFNCAGSVYEYAAIHLIDVPVIFYPPGYMIVADFAFDRYHDTMNGFDVTCNGSTDMFSAYTSCAAMLSPGLYSLILSEDDQFGPWLLTSNNSVAGPGWESMTASVSGEWVVAVPEPDSAPPLCALLLAALVWIAHSKRGAKPNPVA